MEMGMGMGMGMEELGILVDFLLAVNKGKALRDTAFH